MTSEQKTEINVEVNILNFLISSTTIHGGGL